MKRDGFAELHPAVTGLYFAVVIGITMCVPEPGLLAVSFVTAAVYLLRLRGRRGGRIILLGVLPAAIAAALINAAFNHEGATILCYLPGGNPLTLESVLYGLNASVMLAAAAVWFGCVTAVMTSEKIVCIFGKVLPSLGLLISMMLRFLPRFTEMLRETGEARRGLGVTDRDRKGGKTTKLRDAVGNMSAVLGRALENSADTADSMMGAPRARLFLSEEIHGAGQGRGGVYCLLRVFGRIRRARGRVRVQVLPDGKGVGEGTSHGLLSRDVRGARIHADRAWCKENDSGGEK